MAKIEIKVPDIGDYDGVPVIEVLVAVGDTVEVDQGLVTLESDKATMEVPSSAAGVISELHVKVGDTVADGAVIAVLETADAEATGDKPAANAEEAGAAAPAKQDQAAKATSDKTTSDNAASKKSADDKADAGDEKPGESPSDGRGPASTDDAAGKHASRGPQPAAASGRKADVECAMLVLGAGPGGYTAAFRAADLGLDTVLVERYPELGGVCLNVGCIPSKALLHAAAVIDGASQADEMGIAFGKPKIALDKLRGYKNKVVGQLTKGLGGMARQRKVKVITGVGRFLSANELEVTGDDGKTQLVAFRQCVIAAGSQAVKLPGFPWDDPRVMDSTDALELADVPKQLLVVGGGIIGLEMATVYSALGSAVTVVEFMDQLMPGTDKDLVKPLADRLKKQGVEIHLQVKAAGVDAQKKGLKVSFEPAQDGGKAPDAQVFDRVLVAVGRAPNGGKLDAEKAGVKVTERGFIPVDRQMRTTASHIFAIGDLVGNPMLAHKATHEAKLAAEVASGAKKEWVARVIPSVAYTDPEIAWVGVTENEAKARGLKVGVGKFPWAASGRAIGIGRTEGFTKLLFDEASGQVIGGGIVGVHAGELIAEIALAIEMGCEVGDIAHTIHPHPTLSESVAMAAEMFDGTITDLYAPKKKA
ncbi:dihydrolipoyl dehydrogenase [Lysobacter ciconiae]|uniref:Dihydrolipoyl dehydrogenase n=1 Tax=Novilysobacter ciconiae TaxID=2781022 RepID=A0A7S6ZS73_9GAMM|nr:dihydrolipoyl dehydrogenase [Lysobacter ciconiae]QOW19244.1 dihydrolipoyl dehydrogenase [Lysobacter ciconiae]